MNERILNKKISPKKYRRYRIVEVEEWGIVYYQVEMQMNDENGDWNSMNYRKGFPIRFFEYEDAEKLYKSQLRFSTYSKSVKTVIIESE